MPGRREHYNYRGKKRLRRTPYHHIGIRLHDWYHLRKLADKMNLTMVDTMHLMLMENLKAWNIEPLTENPS